MIIDVTAAVIEDSGKYLIARRKEGSHLAGKWEFPGGKIEPGESAQACLRRELMEEFHADAEVGEFLCESTFHYPEKSVRLIAFRTALDDEISVMNDHDQIQWVSPAGFDAFDFAPADIPIVEKIKSLA